MPGYTLISRIFLSYLKIDITAYLQYLVALALFGAAFRYILQYLYGFFTEYFISTAEIRLDDELFNYFMYWMSRQPFMKRSNRFVAGVKTNGYWSDTEHESSGEEDSADEDSDDEDVMEKRTGDECDDPSSGANEGSSQRSPIKAVRRNKYKPLRFTPSQGRHLLWYKGRPIMLERQHQKHTGRWAMNNERLFLSCLGRDPSLLRELIEETQKTYKERDSNKTVIYRAQRYSLGSAYTWTRCMARSPRPLSTVVLDHEQKTSLITDMQKYLCRRTRRWRFNRGLPYRRGYLFHGPPGTGKTSLCFAAAGELDLPLYLLNLNSNELDEDNLYSLFSELPRRCIVLIEDVDTAGITNSRGKTVVDPSQNKEDTPDSTDDSSLATATPIDKSKKDGVTLSGLLNVIDGVAASEGRILVMTTNHRSKLDAALIRPGRVDKEIFFGYTTRTDIEELFRSIYMPIEGDIPNKIASCELSNGKPKSTGNGHITEQQKIENMTQKKKQKERQGRLEMLRSRVGSLATEFTSVIPSGVFTAAEIQGYLLNHANDPGFAIKGAEAWARDLQESKHAREENDF